MIVPTLAQLPSLFGGIDVYLFDQLLKGRFGTESSILDVGCGEGRNIEYLIRAGCHVSVVDPLARNIEAVRRFAAGAGIDFPAERARVEAAEKMSFEDESFDVVLCSAVLHFAENEAHFDAMLRGCWRVLKRGGFFFSRLASTAGQESGLKHLAGRRYRMPDGSERFLVDEAFLAARELSLGAERAEPLKSVIVHGARTMAVWCLTKS